MSSHNLRLVAASHYRQLRLTATHELSGDLSYRLFAKGLNDAWTERHLLVQDRMRWREPILSTEDAISASIALLKEQLLPGIG